MIELKKIEPPEESNTKKNEEESKTAKNPKASSSEIEALTDEEYWEERLFISRGPSGWNIGCGCG